MQKKIVWLIIVLILIVLFIICLNGEEKELSSIERHHQYPWKVHKITEDFQLLDVWEFPIMADPDRNQNFHYFLRVLVRGDKIQWGNLRSPRFLAAGFLIVLRGVLGKIFNLDGDMNVLPIPGSLQKSVRERMSEKDLEHNLAGRFFGEKKNNGKPGFRLVYLFAREALWEISIKPAHALMHLGWVCKENGFYTARLAVYAKTRGVFGEVYLTMIMPFRRSIIYPVMLDVVKAKWRKAQTEKNRGGDEHEGNHDKI